jgi:calcineurin-like phosphoesterase family protein
VDVVRYLDDYVLYYDRRRTDKMSEIWLSSDLHLSHENIIKFCGRPFANVKEMDEALLTYHNELVKPWDHWYNLGDLTMERGGGLVKAGFIKKMRRFHGHKRLLLGNHDHFPTQVYMDCGFEKIYGTWRGIDNLLFSHYPVHPTSIGRARANIHGHIHQNPSPPPARFDGYTSAWNEDSSHLKGMITPYVNVCVEMTAYRPIHLDEVNTRVAAAIVSARLKEEDEAHQKDG